MSDDIIGRFLADPRMWKAAAEFGSRLRRKPGAPDPFKETREAIARMPPVVERKPSDANAREVIAAAERGERLWLEGDEGIVQPMEAGNGDDGAFVRAWRREEDAMHETMAQSLLAAGAKSVEMVGKTMVVTTGKDIRIDLGTEPRDLSGSEEGEE